MGERIHNLNFGLDSDHKVNTSINITTIEKGAKDTKSTMICKLDRYFYGLLPWYIKIPFHFGLKVFCKYLENKVINKE